MFDKRTVFIIGAGASHEFGMPLGPDLMAKVATAVNVGAAGQPNDQDLLNRMREYVGASSAEQLISFGPSLASVTSQFASMDEVLHFLSDQPEVVNLGKITIVREIMKAERESSLFNALNGNEQNITICNRSWASLFLKMALSASRRDQIAHIFEKVTIVDFNYDRVLPQYLYWALQKNLNIPPDKSAECVKNLRLFHPYGSLGPLDCFGASGAVPFGADQGNLVEIARRIRTYTEQTHNPELEQIKMAIEQSAVLIVIGFGYHRQNISIIKSSQNLPQIRVFMTVYGIPDVNRELVQREMQVAFRCEPEPEIFGGIGSALLQDLGLSIRLATTL